MKRNLFMLGLAITCSMAMFAQGAKNIKINEVVTVNETSLQDDFGRHSAWMELANTAFSTYNVRGMYIATDRRVLNQSLTAPQRIALMSIIPNGDERTSLSARQHLIFYFNSNPANGMQYLKAPLAQDGYQWVALYDGNGVDLIDSVTIPPLPANCSYARLHDGDPIWKIKAPDAVTPGGENFIQMTESKIAQLKRDDPHGFGITLLSMGVVFFCLALLFVFFSILGSYMKHKQDLKNAAEKQRPIRAAEKTASLIHEAGHKTNVMLKDGLKTKGIDKEVYMAVIAMALKQYQDDVHDVESGIITIRPHHTRWARTE